MIYKDQDKGEWLHCQSMSLDGILGEKNPPRDFLHGQTVLGQGAMVLK